MIDVLIANVIIVKKTRLKKKDIQKQIMHHLLAELDARRAESYCFT
jgi:hypothetical protein